MDSWISSHHPRRCRWWAVDAGADPCPIRWGKLDKETWAVGETTAGPHTATASPDTQDKASGPMRHTTLAAPPVSTAHSFLTVSKSSKGSEFGRHVGLLKGISLVVHHRNHGCKCSTVNRAE